MALTCIIQVINKVQEAPCTHSLNFPPRTGEWGKGRERNQLVSTLGEVHKYTAGPKCKYITGHNYKYLPGKSTKLGALAVEVLKRYTSWCDSDRSLETFFVNIT